ncbi:hypothetical protein VNO78_16077 [Psophocarpus tetragonolobus]|uniref:Transmembrane protein n=1 Tax=Psophocarpus tetragonolobus TaxID=3891 RepID=A0AAN9XKG6_PSOTE
MSIHSRYLFSRSRNFTLHRFSLVRGCTLAVALVPSYALTHALATQFAHYAPPLCCFARVQHSVRARGSPLRSVMPLMITVPRNRHYFNIMLETKELKLFGMAIFVLFCLFDKLQSILRRLCRRTMKNIFI